MAKTVWFISEHPTPQRVPTFNELSKHLPDARFIYLRADDHGRGWGDLDVMHPAEFWNRLSGWDRFRICLRLLSRDTDEMAVCFGYRGLARIAALAGARVTGAETAIRSDTNQRLVESAPRMKRFLRRVALHAVIPRSVVAWSIGTENERFWRTEVGITRNIRIPYETPLLPGGRKWSAIASRRSDPRSIRILCVGRLVPLKRFADVIAAFVRLEGDEYASWELAIVGEGPERGRLTDLAAGDPRVRFFGAVPYVEMGKIFESADVLAMPSARENWGLVVNEALGYGLYVVASDTVGSAIDLIDETNGILVGVGDVESWAAALAVAATNLERHPKPPASDTAALMLDAIEHGSWTVDHP